MTKRDLVNKQRFIDAAREHWHEATKTRGHLPGDLLYAALNAAVGRLSVAQADKARAAFLQSLRRWANR